MSWRQMACDTRPVQQQEGGDNLSETKLACKCCQRAKEYKKYSHFVAGGLIPEDYMNCQKGPSGQPKSSPPENVCRLPVSSEDVNACWGLVAQNAARSKP